MKNDHLNLYKEFFAKRDFERLELFQLLSEHFSIESVLYPGSFVHVTPSFVFPVTTYVDSDKNAKKFFSDQGLQHFIDQRKEYPQQPQIRFHPADYREPLKEPNESYDLLISQYAGFISQYCKKYLKINGLLLANNSHGDSGMAHIDDDFEFIAAITSRNRRFRLRTEKLGEYFIPKKPVSITKASLEKLGRGIGYTKTAYSYVFQRVR